MSKIIAIANQKGGVGKTTVCQHLACALADTGRRVLCVDLDPQMNLTSSLTREGVFTPQIDINDLLCDLLEESPLPPPLNYVARGGPVDFIPGSKLLSRREGDLQSEIGTEMFLKEILAPLRPSYDYILIDTNRVASPLMVNTLTAADSVLIPLCPEFYSLEGMGDLVTTVLKTKRRLNPSLQFAGIVFSICNLRTVLYREVRADVTAAYSDTIHIFGTAIPRTVKVGDAIRRGLSVMEYEPESSASVAFRALAEEVIDCAEENNASAQADKEHGGTGTLRLIG